MVIRKVKDNEMNCAMTLVWKTFLKFEASDCTEYGISEFRNLISSFDILRKLDIYGAFEDDKLLGVIGVRNKNYISLFFVDEKYQGHGVGRKLFDFVCENNNDGYIDVHSSIYVKEIYEHMGFECVGELEENNGMKYYPMRIEIDKKKRKNR